MSFDLDRVAEAERQLTICNACRYCEGYCAVFPALERRRRLNAADVAHLANLCHDCRACLHACMYAPPHEFGVNVPKVLSQVRLETWDAGVPGRRALAPDRPGLAPDRPGLGDDRAGWSGRAGRRGRGGAAAALAAVLVLIGGLAAATEGVGGLWAEHSDPSPYRVIAYPALLAVMAVPFVWALAAMAVAGALHWRRTHGPLRDLWRPGPLLAAANEAAQLRYLRGGGAGCQYPEDRPSPLRRRAHALVAYGVLACLASTVSAAVLQDALGTPPPYPIVSLPVLCGTVGGAALVVGVGILVAVKRRSDPLATDLAMALRDYGLLVALGVLGATGLATMAARSTDAFGVLLVVHLATVAACFAIAPYTKMNHVTYRFLALVQDNLERARGTVAARPPAE